jgi:membrane protein
MKGKGAFEVIRSTFRNFSKHDSALYAAALAFYAVFSLAPLLLILIQVGGYFWGEQAVRGELLAQLRGFVGDQAASTIEQMLKAARQSGSGLLTGILSAGLLLFAGTSLFTELQVALNRVWDVQEPPDRGLRVQIWVVLKKRLLAFALIFFVGAFLLVTFVAQAVLERSHALVGRVVELGPTVWRLAGFGVTWAIDMSGVAILFKVGPDTHVAWRDAWAGALVTSMLFMIGRVLVGIYVGSRGVGSTAGAAGPIVVLLVWTYYSAQMLLVGAELTHVLCSRRAHSA